MDGVVIHVYESAEGGYAFDIYDEKDVDLDNTYDARDGGLCTTTLKNALEMAYEQTQALVAKDEENAKQ